MVTCELLCNIILNPVIVSDPGCNIDSIIVNDPERIGCVTSESALLFEEVIEPTISHEKCKRLVQVILMSGWTYS